MIKGKSKKQNKRLKIDSLFFLALLLSTQVTCFIGCKLGEITTHNTEKNELQCEKCPKGCGICRKNNQNFYCLSCEEGHFYSDGSCLPCKEECSSCTGPKITDCTELKEGYVFSFKEKTIKKCPNNCLRCTEEQECLECKHGSMSIQTGKKYGKREIVECSPCQEANCRVCSKHKLIFKLGYEVCDQCNEGFGHKMMRRDCVNCLDNCEECDKSHDMCSKCKIGFYLTDNGRKCQKFEIENCEEYDSKTGKCVKCEMYYSLDEENKRCLSCLEVTNGCSTCARDYPGDTSIKNTAVNPKYKGKFYCTGCVEGYNRNFDTGGCEKSEDNCMEKENGVKGSCVQCVPGFYFKKEENKCVEIPKISKIEGCISYDPFNFDSCNVCLDSYFLGGDRKCHKCHPSCSLCNAEGPRNCLYCPINKLIWRIEEHNSRPKFWEEMKFLCLNNCSDLDSDKFKYEKSETGRNCLQNERKEKPSDEDYSFFRFEDKGRRSIIKEIKIFSRKYREYVRQDKLKNMKLQKEKKTDFDPSCSFVGKLKEKLAEDRETIYECDCKEGEYGPLCEISEGLYTASNRFLNKSLKDVINYFTLLF